MLVTLSIAAVQADAPVELVLKIGAIATALIAAGKLLSGGWRVVKRFDQRLAFIDSQMRNNGGSSLRDEVAHAVATAARCDRNIARFADALRDHFGVRVELEPPPPPLPPPQHPR